jgi:putative sigma-54 modulation protein
MKIHISGVHIEVTDSIEEYATKKISSLARYIPHAEDVSANVVLTKVSGHKHKGDIYKTEINIQVRGKLHHTESVKDDLYVSIGAAREDMEKELKHSSGKKEALWKRGAQKIKKIIKGF